MRFTFKLAATGLAVLAVASISISAGAEAKHDSNTLHKLGKAIQYPVRKTGENISMGVHKGVHHDSVKKDRWHNARYVVKPNGAGVYKGTNGHHHHHHHMSHSK